MIVREKGGIRYEARSWMLIGVRKRHLYKCDEVRQENLKT